MRLRCIAVFLSLSCMLLTSCTSVMESSDESVASISSPETSIELTTPTTTETSTEETTTTEETEPDLNPLRRKKYQEALLSLYKDHVWPENCTHSGEEDFWMIDDKSFKISENTFAIADVDCDGKDELIINWVTTAVLAWHGNVLEYDPETDSWKEEGVFNPYDTKFYDNGVVMNPASHNQTWGETIWPYGISHYDPQTDTFGETTGDMSCWDKTFFDLNKGAEGLPKWPAKSDTDNCGTVYFIAYTGYESGKAYSRTEYNAFVAETFGNEIPVSYKKLSIKNINKIAVMTE